MDAIDQHIMSRLVRDGREPYTDLARAVGLFDPAVRLISPELGKTKNATNAKARRVLGWTPRSNEESIVASAESLVKLGLLKGAKKAA